MLEEAKYKDRGHIVVLPCMPGDIVYVDVMTMPYRYLHPNDGCGMYAKCEVVSVVKTKREVYLKLRALYPSRIRRKGFLCYGVGALGKTVHKFPPRRTGT